MLLSVLYSIICLLADLALLRCRGGAARDVELLASRSPGAAAHDQALGLVRRRPAAPGCAQPLPAANGLGTSCRSAPRRCCAGTASWSGANGLPSAGAVGPGDPRSQRQSAS